MAAISNPEAKYRVEHADGDSVTLVPVDTSDAVTLPVHERDPKFQSAVHITQDTALFATVKGPLEDMCTAQRVDKTKLYASDGSIPVRLSYRMFPGKGLGGSSIQLPKNRPARGVKVDEVVKHRGLTVLTIKLIFKPYELDNKGGRRPGTAVGTLIYTGCNDGDKYEPQPDLERLGVTIVEGDDDDDDDTADGAAAPRAGKKRKTTK